MKTSEATTVKPGMVLVYDDGRPGHSVVRCDVINVHDFGMLVQFEDLADNTSIRFTDSAWMDYLTIA